MELERCAQTRLDALPDDAVVDLNVEDAEIDLLKCFKHDPTKLRRLTKRRLGPDFLMERLEGTPNATRWRLGQKSLHRLSYSGIR